MFRAIRSISVSSYLQQAIDAVVWLRTDLVSKQPMRIRAFNSRMIDGSFTHDKRMAIFRRDKVFAKPARTAVDNWEADHKLPRSHGGKATVENGQVACLVAQRIKGGDDTASRLMRSFNLLPDARPFNLPRRRSGKNALKGFSRRGAIA